MVKEKNRQIEGLRGIACLIVVVYHMFDRFQQVYLNSEIGFMNHLGTFGTLIKNSPPKIYSLSESLG